MQSQPHVQPNAILHTPASSALERTSLGRSRTSLTRSFYFLNFDSLLWDLLVYILQVYKHTHANTRTHACMHTRTHASTHTQSNIINVRTSITLSYLFIFYFLSWEKEYILKFRTVINQFLLSYLNEELLHNNYNKLVLLNLCTDSNFKNL